MNRPQWLEASTETWPYTQEIVKGFGSLDRIIDWCKQEMSADWRWQLLEPSTDQRPGKYVFYFEIEKDFLAFVLKWS